MVYDPGHDWFHVDRVRKLALYIAKKEKADLFIVELSALLHDIADYKFHKGNDKLGGQVTSKWLKKNGLDRDVVKVITDIVDNISFRGAQAKYTMKTLEGKIVHDADKLDALGAIGIARTFNFGGKFGASIHLPGTKPTLHSSFAQYKKLSASTINHFYEKLLLLKDRMHTKTAKRIALRRHKFMEMYLKEFYREWGEVS